MNKELLAAVSKMLSDQAEFVVDRYLMLVDRDGEASARESLELGQAASQKLIDVLLTSDQQPSFADWVMYSAWPMASMLLDLIDDGYMARQAMDGIWLIGAEDSLCEKMKEYEKGLKQGKDE